MNFDSAFFLACFLPVLMALYALAPGLRAKNVLLLITGFVFYCFGSISGLVLLAAVSLVNFALGLGVMRARAKRAFAAAAVVIDLLFLGFFKYLDFLMSSLMPRAGSSWTPLGLAAPIGISFFTFKCISYIIDVYRAPESGTRSFYRFLLYISFFPQLMAGPIERFQSFDSQLTSRTVSAVRAAEGMRRFITGLAKKLILSAAACRVADAVFALDDASLDMPLAWLGAAAYTLQIYFDFSGYSDMAIGAGRMLGFDTAENFNYPYAAASIGGFWRRWHISLSSWFRDYVYIPLGGNRRGRARAALNKFIVFALCGLWHGAAWTFILWGVWHGLLSAVESFVPRGRKSAPLCALGHVWTLLAVCLGFVMFRAASVGEGLRMISAMFGAFDTTLQSTVAMHTIATAKNVSLMIAGAVLCLPVRKLFCAPSGELRPWCDYASMAGCVALLLVCVSALAVGGFAPFIYFQF